MDISSASLTGVKPIVPSDYRPQAGAAAATPERPAAQESPATATAAAQTTPLKSLTYGVLGLEHPEDQARHGDPYYTAGKFVAAAATVGAFLSLVV